MPNNEPSIGNSKKIVGIKPKFYIKDNGTDYTDGEEFNGLWSAGDDTTPTGYANMGHWKLNEEEGSIAFNNRVRGHTDLYCAGTSWSSDGVGNYLQYNLPNNDPLGSASPNYFIMIGTGSSYSETDAFDSFVKANTGGTGFGAIRGYEAGKYMFDMWAYFRTPPASSGDIQTLFYLHHTGDIVLDKRLRFCIENVGGTPVLAMYYYHFDFSSSSFDRVYSANAGAALFPNGVSQEGGLHQIGFIFDRTVIDGGNIEFNTAPYGFYIDGKYYPADSGSTSGWSQNSLSIDTNAFIGCEINGNNPSFTATKSTGDPKFINHFTGKLYQAQLSSVTGATEARMRMIHGLKFDIPRGPTPVDFSERYEYDGRNLLQEIGRIDQVIGNDKGAFYININQVKVRN